MFWGLIGPVWVLEYPSSQLGMGVVGQNECGGVKQCTFEKCKCQGTISAGISKYGFQVKAG